MGISMLELLLFPHIITKLGDNNQWWADDELVASLCTICLGGRMTFTIIYYIGANQLRQQSATKQFIKVGRMMKIEELSDKSDATHGHRCLVMMMILSEGMETFWAI